MSQNSKSLSIALPENWQDQTIYTYKGPDEGGVQHNLVVTVDSEVETTDPAIYARQRLQALQQILAGFELLSERSRSLKSGMEAYELVFKWVPSEGKVIFQKQVCALSNGHAFNFTASFSKQTLKTIGCDVDAMIDSFMPG